MNIELNKLQNFTYPDYNVPFVTAFGGMYECVFVIFHPFIALPENIAMKVTDYLSEKMIIEFGKKINWSWMAKQSNLDNCSIVNQALLTSIGALRKQYQDQKNFTQLNKIIETYPIYYPGEGEFEPILYKVFQDAFNQVKAQQIIYVPEFAFIDEVKYYTLAEFTNMEITEFPARGTLISADGSLLFTVDWDSFFTLCYGRREQVKSIVYRNTLEGFFAEKTHSHWWYRQEVNNIVNA